jgi:hypothetical protein
VGLVSLPGIEYGFFALAVAIWIIGGNIVRARYRRRTGTPAWSEFVTPFTSLKAFLSYPWSGLNRAERLTMLAVFGFSTVFAIIGALIADAR